MLKPFWREEPLNPNEQALLDDVILAHQQSCMRGNISTVTLYNAFTGSSSFTQAVAAALCTLGGAHGPVEDAYDVLIADNIEKLVLDTLERGEKVAGFGNGFFKKEPDPLWAVVHRRLEDDFHPMAAVIDAACEVLWRMGRDIHPNPACFTAATALVLGIPRHLSPWIFVTGRLDGWAKLLLKL